MEIPPFGDELVRHACRPDKLLRLIGQQDGKPIVRFPGSTGARIHKEAQVISRVSAGSRVIHDQFLAGMIVGTGASSPAGRYRLMGFCWICTRRIQADHANAQPGGPGVAWPVAPEGSMGSVRRWPGAGGGSPGRI